MTTVATGCCAFTTGACSTTGADCSTGAGGGGGSGVAAATVGCGMVVGTVITRMVGTIFTSPGYHSFTSVDGLMDKNRMMRAKRMLRMIWTRVGSRLNRYTQY